MFYIKRILFTTEMGTKDYIDLKPGLNIIHGPSNTGKSLIVDSIDYMYGAKPKKITDNSVRFKNITMILDVDGQPLTLSRDINSSFIDVSGNVNSIDNGKYTQSGKKSINQLWLQLMGIYDPVSILQYMDGTPQSLTVRTFLHTFLINETRMSSDLSILQPKDGYHNLPVSTLMSLIYLMTGITYTDGEKIKPKKIIDAENKAVISFVDRSMSRLHEEKVMAMRMQDDEIPPEKLQEKIEIAKRAISEAEKHIDELTEKSQKLASEVIGLDQQITESKVLKNRYNSLMTQYESDIKRLTFIAEGDLHKDSLPKLDHCPFCNGELPKDIEESCVEAAVAEVRKIELQIKDLASASKILDDEIAELSSEKKRINEARRSIQKQIQAELEPKLTDLQNDLNSFRVSLGRQKVADIFEHVANTIYNEMQESMEGELVLPNIDVREKVKEIIGEPLNVFLPQILTEADYDNFTKAVFDIETVDIKINGKEKAIQGQGYRAYLNAVMAIAMQEMLVSSNLYKPNILVMDSPILSFAEKKIRPGETAAPDHMKKGLFRYMDAHTVGYQAIIIENVIPDIEYKNANILEFTKDTERDRYGLIESYHEN